MVRYVAECVKCQKSKADRHSRQTKLVLMPIEERPFEEIAMDFVGELPESEGFNAILVVTDRFTKGTALYTGRNNLDHKRHC